MSGLVAMAVVTGLLSFADTLPAFLAGRAAQGIVAASFPPVALSLLSEALPPSRRPLGVSLISFSFLAAAPVAQFVAVGVPVTPTAFMLAVAPLYLVMAAGLFLALPPQVRMRSASPHGRVQEGRGSSPFRSPVIVAGWGAALTVLFGFVIFQAGTAMGIGSRLDPQVVRLIGLPPLALSLVAAPIKQPGCNRTGCPRGATASGDVDLAAHGRPAGRGSKRKAGRHRQDRRYAQFAGLRHRRTGAGAENHHRRSGAGQGSGHRRGQGVASGGLERIGRMRARRIF